jgi:hypothetical protein
MQPFSAALGRKRCGARDKLFPKALSAKLRMNRRIKQKGMQGPVARYLHKDSQPPLVTRCDMEQAGALRIC